MLLWCLAPMIHCLSAASSSSTRDAVVQQLGYWPTNFVRVAAWTSHRQPLVIQTYPLQGGSPRRQKRSPNTPFPTLYWLCHADIAKHVGHLERDHWIATIENDMLASRELTEDLWGAHRRHASTRWESLRPDDLSRLPEAVQTHLRYSGVAGTSMDTEHPCVKCLHAHYADYRVNLDNPVGERVHSILQTEFPDLIL